ncbi:MAG: sigma-70 family RNA polymerase sigma factor [Actinomycetota bacterium]|nr:sigma-70 family RNA polymerase sigma factor [Actinomycetota bacterium]
MLGLYCGDGDLADELAQEALVRLCRHWDQLPSEADAARWVNRVAFNLAKSTFRTRAVRKRVTERYGPTLAPSEGTHDRDTSLAVRTAVARLPERQRRVIILRYFCDLPVRDVADRMGCPEGTVKSLTSQAIVALRASGLEFSDD